VGVPASCCDPRVCLGCAVCGRGVHLPVPSAPKRANLSTSSTPLVCPCSSQGPVPPEPEAYSGPKLKVAIVGRGWRGMSTAVELLDQGHEVRAHRGHSDTVTPHRCSATAQVQCNHTGAVQPHRCSATTQVQ